MRRCAVAIFAGSVLCGCGASSSPAPTPAATAARDTRSIDIRLQGGWRLVDYMPDVPLEPMFQLILTQQIQTMVVRFQAGRLLADSPTMHADRTYQVTDAAGPFFKIVSPDYGGGTLTSSCQLSDDGNRVSFHSESEPWRGAGTLQRLP